MFVYGWVSEACLKPHTKKYEYIRIEKYWHIMGPHESRCVPFDPPQKYKLASDSFGYKFVSVHPEVKVQLLRTD